MEKKIIGRQDILLAFEDAIKGTASNQGSFILVSGDTGTGKTHLIEYLQARLDEYNESLGNSSKSNKKSTPIYDVAVACKPPIGSFNIGTMEPLNTVSNIVKGLMNDSSMTPEKRFAISVGMTLLACLPMIGEIPYAFKEISRDLTKLKSEQKTNNSELRSGAFEEYIEYIDKYLAKKPACIFLDDFHWADAESVEFIWTLVHKITNKPVIIVATYKPLEAESQGLPLLSMLNRLGESSNMDTFNEFRLTPFTLDEINSCAKRIYFSNYKSSHEFENWIFDHSNGVPSVVAEYLEYFAKYSPFDMAGNLVTNFNDNEFLPTSIQQLFGQKLDDMTEDERNILSICSAEGKEFTAIIISKLLNTDVLDTIKKLRSIQNKTGIIKSIGAKYRYGIKTTVYQYTQAYYQTYFENTLEYEESVALHSQVALFLKERYNNASEEIRQALAPMIAAHSTIAGDIEQAEEMLLKTADTAKQYDSSDTIKQAFNNMGKNEDLFEREFDFTAAMENILKDVELRNSSGIVSENTTEDGDYLFDTMPEYKELRRMIVKDILKQNYSLSIAKIDKVIADERIDLDGTEILQLRNFKIKALIELKDYTTAEQLLNETFDRAKEIKNLELQCFTLNNWAVWYMANGNNSAAIVQLESASGIAMNLPPELRLLTLANIAITLRHLAPIKAEKYYEKVKEQCQQAGFTALEKDLDNIFKKS